MSGMTQRVVVISGGAGGAGLTITQSFARQGDLVYVVEREQTSALITSLGNERIHFIAADVFIETSVAQAIEQITREAGHLDVLVNIVGGYAAGQPIHELDSATWDQMMQLNLRSTFLLSKYAARPMIAQRHGHIVNFSARAARDTAANAGAYAVSKAGVIALTEVQAKELLEFNVTVNAILPSIIDTPANRQAMPAADFQRWPKAEEIASVVRFLASDDAALISGASIPVYGRG